MKSQSAEIKLSEFLFQSDAKIDGLENAIKSETCEKCTKDTSIRFQLLSLIAFGMPGNC